MRTLQILGMGGYESAKLVRKGFKQKIHICQKHHKNKKFSKKNKRKRGEGHFVKEKEKRNKMKKEHKIMRKGDSH